MPPSLSAPTCPVSARLADVYHGFVVFGPSHRSLYALRRFKTPVPMFQLKVR